MNTTTISFKHQQGSTLIEIMVSMFILALGLMALIAMQTRTSIGIKEAENQTIIAQATENLAENMMTNPKLSNSGTTTQRSYEHYTNGKTNGSVAIDCAGGGGAAANPPGVRSSGDQGRQALANFHLADFSQMACLVKNNGSEGEITIAINNDSTNGTAATGQTLHVTWTMGGSSGKQYTYDYPLDDNL